MLYENYQRKMENIVKAIRWIKKHRFYFIASFAIILALVATALSFKGTVYAYGEVPPQITYGQDLGYNVNAFLSPVKYEYAPIDSSIWTSTPPSQVGKFKVRSVSKGLFGKTYYGKVWEFEVLPKKIDVRVGQTSITYGQNPTVTASLAHSDTIVCTDFIYGSFYSSNTTVTPNPDSIYIYDRSGKNKTSSYIINPVQTPISFTKREISVSTPTATREYDGTPLNSASFNIINGALVNSDNLNAENFAEITNVGTVANTAIFSVYNIFGENVNHLYKITTITGVLSVTHRNISITSKSAQKVYDGQSLADTNFTLNYGSLVNGHTIHATNQVRLTDVGSITNALSIIILDARSTDVTNNYFIETSFGTLTITKLNITLNTPSQEWTYDGFAHTNTDIICDNLPTDHTFALKDVAQITDAGLIQNTMAIEIMRGAVVATHNFNITINYGTLKVNKCEITIFTPTRNWEYDGKIKYDTQVFASFLPASHEIIIDQNYATIQNVGEISNTMTAKITQNDIDKSHNFAITYNYGTLSVYQRQIMVTTHSHTYEYDGQPQSHRQLSIDRLIDTHTYTIVYYTQITLPSLAQNKILIQIYNNQTDVTANYYISYIYGTLEVIPRTITVSTASDTWEYDGQTHSNTHYEITKTYGKTPLVNGHTATLSQFPTIHDVSQSPTINAITITIFEGVIDVTRYYDIVYLYGNLTLTPRTITVTTATQEWTYDGLIHYNINYTTTKSVGNALVNNHYSFANNYTIITEVIRLYDNEVGSVSNDISILIFDDAENMTHNYKITYVFGTLKINPRLIVINTPSNAWEYDDQEHFDIDFSKPTEVLSWHKHVVISYTTIINVGSKTNILSVSIFEVIASGGGGGANDGNTSDGDDGASGGDTNDGEVLGGDKTFNYDITFNYGILMVYPREIEVKLDDVTFIYDALPHTSNIWSYVSAKQMVEGHTADVLGGGSQTNVGICNNPITQFTILNKDYQDVTFNYNIIKNDGIIKVIKRDINIIAGSDYKIYDGTPLTSTEVYHQGTTELESGLIEWHVLTAQTKGSITNVGRTNNEIILDSIIISDGQDDVTDNYNIHTFMGMLSIYCAELEFITATAVKIYDGTPLTAFEYEMYGELINGDLLYTSMTSSITNPGSIKNSITITITNSLGEIITSNYKINTQLGGLVVIRSNGNLQGGSGGIGSGSGEMLPLFTATSDTDGIVYFRQESFGNFGYDYWEYANPYTATSINPLYYPADALVGAGHATSTVYIEPVQEYLLYMLANYTTKTYPTTSDVFIARLIEQPYYLEYISYEYDLEDGLQISPQYISAEQAYYQYVRNNYLDLPADTRLGLEKIILDNNLQSASIIDIKNFIQNYIPYGDEGYSDDYVLYFFNQAQFGVCRHYATAATALFRALGIPARYTVGFAKTLKAGETIDVIRADAHAWVEVYIKGLGWIQLEVTNGGIPDSNPDFDYPTDPPDPPDKIINVNLYSIKKAYDGTPLSYSEDDYYLTNLPDGLRLELKLEGSITDVGVYDIALLYQLPFKVFDGSTDVTSEYKLNFVGTPLTVTAATIEFTSASAEKEYDGNPLVNSNVWVSKGKIPYGHTFWASVTGNITQVGNCENVIESITIINSEGIDVTNYFNISIKNGTLTVT